MKKQKFNLTRVTCLSLFASFLVGVIAIQVGVGTFVPSNASSAPSAVDCTTDPMNIACPGSVDCTTDPMNIACPGSNDSAIATVDCTTDPMNTACPGSVDCTTDPMN